MSFLPRGSGAEGVEVAAEACCADSSAAKRTLEELPDNELRSAMGRTNIRIGAKRMAVSGLSDAVLRVEYTHSRGYPAVHQPATVPKSKRLFPVFRKEPIAKKAETR
jgi:hypothetical protein